MPASSVEQRRIVSVIKLNCVENKHSPMPGISLVIGKITIYVSYCLSWSLKKPYLVMQTFKVMRCIISSLRLSCCFDKTIFRSKAPEKRYFCTKYIHTRPIQFAFQINQEMIVSICFAYLIRWAESDQAPRNCLNTGFCLLYCESLCRGQDNEAPVPRIWNLHNFSWAERSLDRTRASGQE